MRYCATFRLLCRTLLHGITGSPCFAIQKFTGGTCLVIVHGIRLMSFTGLWHSSVIFHRKFKYFVANKFNHLWGDVPPKKRVYTYWLLLWHEKVFYLRRHVIGFKNLSSNSKITPKITTRVTVGLQIKFRKPSHSNRACWKRYKFRWKAWGDTVANGGTQDSRLRRSGDLAIHHSRGGKISLHIVLYFGGNDT